MPKIKTHSGAKKRFKTTNVREIFAKLLLVMLQTRSR